MKRNRYLLCILACGFMLYFAVPRLSVTINGEKGIFSIAWLTFALVVIAGNLTGILYHPKKSGQSTRKAKLNQSKLKSRSYH